MSFRDASAVERVADGRYRAEVQPGWDIAGNANGGYLLATAARAMLDASEREAPLTVTAHYLRPGRPGPVEVETEIVRAGRSLTVVRGMLAGEDPHLALLGTFGELGGGEAPERVDAEAPALPPVDECVAMVASDTFPPPFMDKVDLRLHPADAGFLQGDKSGWPRMRGWFRFPDDETIDAIGLLQASDAFPPTVFNADLPVAWTPTIELTAHVRAQPTPGWLKCVFQTRFVTGGFLEADGEIWDVSDRLVAQSRQLALVPRG